MTAAATSTVAGGLSSLLSSLSGRSLLGLGNYLTSANEARALSILSAMAANPTGASALYGSLMAIPNLPPAVGGYVSAALASPATFTANLEAAEQALVAEFTSETALQKAGF